MPHVPGVLFLVPFLLAMLVVGYFLVSKAENPPGETYFDSSLDKEPLPYLEEIPAQRGASFCHSWSYREVGMSDCKYGCKIYACTTCGKHEVVHLEVYGHMSTWTEKLVYNHEEMGL